MKTDGLTQRRLEVAQLIYEGLSDKQIADALQIKVRTVNTHLHAIAFVWQLDPTKDLRVQIVRRVTTKSASQSSNRESDRAA